MSNILPQSDIVNAEAPPIGSHDDIYNRLAQTLPVGWFGNLFSGDGTNESTVLEGYINCGEFVYSLLQYVQLQMRLQTATDNNLDLISQDYLGSELPRRTGETDDSYRARISSTILQPKATRSALANAIYSLTGYQPILYEPWLPSDNMAYNIPSAGGYNIYGGYGSGSQAYQGYIIVYVSAYAGMGNFNGFNKFYGGYNSSGSNAQGWYGGSSLQNTVVTDEDIYQLIALTKAEGTKIWTTIYRI